MDNAADRVKSRLKKIKERDDYKKLESEYVTKAQEAKKDTKKVGDAMRVDALLRALESDALGPLKSEELEKLKKKPRQKKTSRVR